MARIASIPLSDGTVASRFYVWEHIGTAVLRKPWSGYGARLHLDQVVDKRV